MVELIDHKDLVSHYTAKLMENSWPENAAKLCAMNAVEICEAVIQAFLDTGNSKSSVVHIQASLIAANMLVDKFNDVQDHSEEALKMLELIGSDLTIPEDELAKVRERKH